MSALRVLSTALGRASWLEGAPFHDRECHEKRGGYGADGEESGRVDEADV